MNIKNFLLAVVLTIPYAAISGLLFVAFSKASAWVLFKIGLASRDFGRAWKPPIQT